MKIYRGPRTKDFTDDSHQLVDTKKIGDAKPWTSTTNVQVNVTKDPKEREAVATLQFDESDIDGLYQALSKGRENHSRKLEAMTKSVERLERALDSIKRLALTARIRDKNDAFTKIISIVQEEDGTCDGAVIS